MRTRRGFNGPLCGFRPRSPDTVDSSPYSVSDDPYLAFEDHTDEPCVTDEPPSCYKVYLFFPGVAAIAKNRKCIQVNSW